eukprot:120142_1
MTSTGVYKWKIQSFTNVQKDLLCCAYVRLNFDGYIPNAIIKLLSKHFVSKLDDIKNASANKGFQSEIFAMNTLKWLLYIQPNGCSETHLNTFVVFIYLYSVLYDISKISTSLTLIISETNDYWLHDDYEFKRKKKNFLGGCMKNGRCRIEFPQDELDKIRNLNQLTFEFVVDILEVYDNNDNKITSEYVNDMKFVSGIELPCATFQWIISDSFTLQVIKNTHDRQQFLSPVYKYGKFKVIVALIINDKDNMSSINVIFEEYPEDVHIIRFDCIVSVPEIYIFPEEKTDNICHIAVPGKVERPTVEISTENFQNLDLDNILTFDFKFTLIDVYDDNGHCMKNYIDYRALKETEFIEERTLEEYEACFMWYRGLKRYVRQYK